MVTIQYGAFGRGAWPVPGLGGTLSWDGKRPGPYYVTAASGNPPVGLIGARAVQDNTPCSIDHYAVHRAVKTIQENTGVPSDGVWGPRTGEAVRLWQRNHGLVADGIFGRASATALVKPMVLTAAREVAPSRPELWKLCVGHAAYESAWDFGAVGAINASDVGLCQINLRSHPDLTLDFCLAPNLAARWLAGFVRANFIYAAGNVRDAVAAYNLGRGGLTQWINAGRPDSWVRSYNGTPVTSEVKRYIDRVLALSEA